MGICVILPGSIVMIVTSRFMRRQLFEPQLIVMQQSTLVIIYEYCRSYVHRVYQTQSFTDTALDDQVFHRVCYIHESPPIWDFEPKFFSKAFHHGLMPFISISQQVRSSDRRKREA